jgi:hypothetical protein
VRRPDASNVRLPREPFRGTTRELGWQRLSHGLYWPVEKPKEIAETLRAWALVLPEDAAFTHLTAVKMYGWWQSAEVPHPLFAAVGPDTPVPHRSSLCVSRHRNPPPVVVIDGVRLTSPPETMLALARDLSVLDLVVLGDSALRLGHCTIDELKAVAAQRRRGAPRLREVIPLLDERSESAWESIMRVLHRAADIPVEPQREIFDHMGKFVARVDLWLVGTRRVHEYDGGGHRDAAVHKRDLVREGKLVRDDWQRVGFVASQLLSDGALIIAGADRLLGRAWDPRRLQRWEALLNQSLLRPSGRARVLARWSRSMHYAATAN